MGEHRRKKPRTCRKCGKELELTAGELQAHADRCKGKLHELVEDLNKGKRRG